MTWHGPQRYVLLTEAPAGSATSAMGQLGSVPRIFEAGLMEDHPLAGPLTRTRESLCRDLDAKSGSRRQMPGGITIRPLAGPAEVPAYVAAHRATFESEAMTVA